MHKKYLPLFTPMADVDEGSLHSWIVNNKYSAFSLEFYLFQIGYDVELYLNFNINTQPGPKCANLKPPHPLAQFSLFYFVVVEIQLQYRFSHWRWCRRDEYKTTTEKKRINIIFISFHGSLRSLTVLALWFMAI